MIAARQPPNKIELGKCKMKHEVTTTYRPTREESEAVVRMLVDTYPACFFDNPRQRRPLKKNIASDAVIDKVLQVADEAIIAAVHWYQSNIGYAGYAMSVPGAARLDLNGNAAGTVTPKEALEAQNILNDYHAKKNEQANNPVKILAKIPYDYGVGKMVDTPITRTKAPQIPSEFVGLYETLIVASNTVAGISEPAMRLVIARAALGEVIKKAEQIQEELNATTNGRGPLHPST